MNKYAKNLLLIYIQFANDFLIILKKLFYPIQDLIILE
jgi:hypothetical protein